MIVVAHYVKPNPVCCLLSFLVFLGTLPSGVHLLICAHPKRRKSKEKKYTRLTSW